MSYKVNATTLVAQASSVNLEVMAESINHVTKARVTHYILDEECVARDESRQVTTDCRVTTVASTRSYTKAMFSSYLPSCAY